MKKLILVLMLAAGCFAGKYTTYADRTVWIERQNELGQYDTLEIKEVIAKNVEKNETTLVLYNGNLMTIKLPHMRIIKEAGE